MIGSLLALLALLPLASDSTEYYNYRVERVTERVHYLHQPISARQTVSGNVAIFEQSGGYVVFDTGGTPYFGRQVVEAVESLGTDKPVTAIVISHWHDDHPLGTQALIARWPDAVIISSHDTRDHLDRIYGPTFGNGPASERYQTYMDRGRTMIAHLQANLEEGSADPEMAAGMAMTLADVERMMEARQTQRLLLPELTIETSLILHDPEYPLEIRYIGRANTDGDLILWSPTDRVVAAGDIVVAPMPYGIQSFPEDWPEALAQINALGFAYLIPGHGTVQQDGEYIARLENLIAETRRQIAASLDEGTAQEDVVAQIDLGEMRVQFSEGNAFREMLFTTYWLTPMVDNIVRLREAEQRQ